MKNTEREELPHLAYQECWNRGYHILYMKNTETDITTPCMQRMLEQMEVITPSVLWMLKQRLPNLVQEECWNRGYQIVYIKNAETEVTKSCTWRTLKQRLPNCVHEERWNRGYQNVYMKNAETEVTKSCTWRTLKQRLPNRVREERWNRGYQIVYIKNAETEVTKSCMWRMLKQRLPNRVRKDCWNRGYHTLYAKNAETGRAWFIFFLSFFMPFHNCDFKPVSSNWW